VVLGPAWQGDQADRSQSAQGDEAVLSAVRAAAGQLLAALEQAEQLTGGWADQPLAAALVDAALSACLSRLAQTGLWGEANRLPSSELWKIAGPLLEVGVLQHAARFKPRGYAGDFQMLARICDGYRCDHPLGRAFDEFFQNQAAPQAVRARTEQTAAAIASDCLSRDRRGYHVVSVGSGPGLDVCRALSMLPQDRRAVIRVTLLDMDPDALHFAQTRLEPLLPEGATGTLRGGQKATWGLSRFSRSENGTVPFRNREAVARPRLTCIRTNLFRLPQNADPSVVLEPADFLVCSGLFDYLEDEPAAAMLRWFWEQLAPGGLLLVGNFAPHNPTRAYMEWIGNWYLVYRTADALAELAARAGVPAGQATVGSERLGVDLFLAGRKPG
jgi:hypothetical protein